MMLVLTLLAGLVGVTTALQRTSWDSQWSNSIFGQIDFRYPDWVLSPRPPCVQEGVFPHPRSHNCTWYYRCVARVGVPRFATFYFECEPGTMFEDDLDQCVHPHSGYNCQGVTTQRPITTQPPNRCSILQSSCRNYKICGGGVKQLCQQEQCTRTGVKDMCYGGQLWDVVAHKCVEKPAPCPVITTECVTVASSCRDVEVCTGTSRYKQTLCEREHCHRGSQDIGERPMCYSPSQLYDTTQKMCVTTPAENTCSSCEFTATNCRQYDLCNPSGVRRLCDCIGCGPGMMYDPSTKVCIAKTALCPVLECVFRDSVCSCVNGMSLCTGCYMRGNFIHVAQFCKAQSSPEFYHVEKDTCLYSNPGFIRATSGHCPRTRDSLLGSALQPSLQCSLRDNSVIRCWSDYMN